jgi:thioredoxin
MDKNKKRITIILSIVIVLIILIVASITTIILFNKKKKSTIENKTELAKIVSELGIQDKNIEYGTNFNLANFKIPNDVKVLIDGEEVTNTYTFKNLGKTDITFEKLDNKGQKETATINVNIVDTKQPEIIGAEDRTVKQGETIDLKENIKVEDNTDELIDVSVIGKVDTNVPGEYEITYIATDQSNNSSEKKIKITVEANPNAVANNNDNNNKPTENKNNTQKVLNTQQNNHSNAKSEQKVAEQPKQQPQPQSVPKSQPTQPAQPAPVAPKQTSQPTPVKPKQTQESTPAPQPKPKENKVIYANLSNFEQIVLKSTKPVIVDFYTETCGICKYISPIIDEMAKERTDFKIVKIDANKNFALAKRYNFRLVPTLIVFRDGKEVKRITQPGTKSEILSLTR